MTTQQGLAIELAAPAHSSSMTRRLLRVGAAILGGLIVLYLAICGYMAYRLSHPAHLALERNPAQFGLDYEDVNFESAGDNIPLRGWYIDSPGDRVILLLHGMEGNRASETDLSLARALMQHDYDVLMFDFRAHGESGDAPMSVGEHEVRDLAGAVRFLQGRGVQTMGVLGMSMGAVTTLNGAADLPELRALVLDSPFAQASALIANELPQRSGLPGWFIPGMVLMGKLLYNIHLDENNPIRGMERLGTRPVLHIHGTNDTTIPLSQALLLNQAGAQNPNMEAWMVEGAGHTGAYMFNPAVYEARVFAFFDKYLK